MATDEKRPEDKAIRLLNQQLKELQTVRGMTFIYPEFTAWRDTTMGLLQRFLSPGSEHLLRFKNLKFRGLSRRWISL
jgi:hypothetical protein